MKGQYIMNKVIKYTILLVTFSLSGAADIKVTTKTDVEASVVISYQGKLLGRK